MFKELLLVGAALLVNGSVLTLKSPQKANNPVSSDNFQYFSDLFPNYTVSWTDYSMTASVTIGYDQYIDLLDLPPLDMFYFGDFNLNNDIEEFYWSVIGDNDSFDYLIPVPADNTVPFAFFIDVLISDFSRLYQDFGFPFTYNLSFTFSGVTPINQRSGIESDFESNIALINEEGIAEYIAMVASDNYDLGVAVGEATADGGWLGNLVFGTIGGIVGLLFAISDFEVLGVSIMSIITLFVAIGIIIILLKVLK